MCRIGRKDGSSYVCGVYVYVCRYNVSVRRGMLSIYIYVTVWRLNCPMQTVIVNGTKSVCITGSQLQQKSPPVPS